MSQTPEMRILDASLNRAGEGLRVVEDFTRFSLDDRFLTGRIKSLRHDLATVARMIPTVDRHAARESQDDVGREISTQTETDRADLWHVCAASVKRAEQALRSLEEYGKLVNTEFSESIEALRYRLYTLEKAIDIGRASREQLEGVRLCVLVDGRQSAEEFQNLVSGLIDAGVHMLQLRAKALDDRGLVGRARQLRHLTRGTKTICVINDRADIAAAVGADGVHVGQEDLSVKDARVIVGSHMLVGVSTHNIDQARRAVLDGATYLGAGPTFSSKTKAFEAFAGTVYLREVAAEIRLPTFAIGGITGSNLQEVLTSGIGRVAVSSAVVGAASPTEAAREILRQLRLDQSAAGRHCRCDPPIQHQSPVSTP